MIQKKENALFSLPAVDGVTDVWQKLASESRPIVVYGMGNGADKLIARFERYGIPIADFFASDGFVRGHSFHGKRVKSFSEICGTYPDFVIVLSFASHLEDVLSMLTDMDEKYDMVIPDMPVAGGEYFDSDFYREHYAEIKRAYDLFADEESRRLFASLMHYRLSGRMSELLACTQTADEIYALLGDRRFLLDVGAYRGDTLREAISYFPRLCRVTAVEPDGKNFQKLSAFAETLSAPEVECIHAAAWSENGEASFFGSGNRNSTLNATASFEHSEKTVPLLRLDSLKLENLDYVKYDVEGAEAEALEGTDGLIRRFSPALLVSVYHRSGDVFSIPLALKERYPNYRFYLRRTRCVPAWEINLICLPENK